MSGVSIGTALAAGGIAGGLGAAGSMASAAMGSAAASDAANAQVQAANTAANAQLQAQKEADATQLEMFNKSFEAQAPWRQAGGAALTALEGLVLPAGTAIPGTGSAGTPGHWETVSGASGGSAGSGQVMDYTAFLNSPLFKQGDNVGDGETQYRNYRASVGVPPTYDDWYRAGGFNQSDVSGLSLQDAYNNYVKNNFPSATSQQQVWVPGTPGTLPQIATGTPSYVTDAYKDYSGAVKDYGDFIKAGPGEYTQSPGYLFRLSQGIQAQQQAAAASGMLLSGAQQKALTQFGQDYATNDYQNFLANWYNRVGSYGNRANSYGNLANTALSEYTGTTLAPLESLAGLGQQSVQSTGSLGQTTANAIGNYAMTTGGTLANTAAYAGNARASGYMAQNAVNQGMIGNLYNIANGSSGGSPFSLSNLSSLWGPGSTIGNAMVPYSQGDYYYNSEPGGMGYMG